MLNALNQIVESLQSVAGCVTQGRLLPLTSGPTTAEIRFVNSAPMRFRGALRGCSIDVRCFVGWLVEDGARSGAWIATGYLYRLRDASGRELLTYHWHPDSPFSTPTFPHPHVSAALRSTLTSGVVDSIPLDKLHLPTGNVPLAAFVRMLVAEFGAQPAAADWEARLRQATEPTVD